MSCPFTLDGNQCQLPDRNHYDCHVTAERIKFTDRGSDQAQPKAA